MDQDNTEEAVFILTTSCAEFYVFVIGVGVGGILFLFGAVWAILWSYRRREIYHDVDEIRKNFLSPFPLPRLSLWCGGESLANLFFAPLIVGREKRRANSGFAWLATLKHRD